VAKFNILNYLKNYYRKKSKFSLASDVFFLLFIVLLIVPASRVEVMSFVIRLTSMSPSELKVEDQFTITAQDRTWQLSDMNGDNITLSSLMDDRPVFINFWATWCPPCVAELPGIAELYNKYGNQVHFILATNEPATTVLPFAEKRQLTKLPFYQYHSTPAAFYSESIPTTFLLSKNGKVVLSKKGAARWDSDRMGQIIDQLLKE
jgi:thiol-disulfide isomerase/thioredoxin